MAIWPSAIATDADLYVAVNSLQTTLATSLGTGDTSVVLASATGFPVAGAVTIGNEVIFYTNVSGATLTGCTRGADGTTAATHSVGVPVGAAIIAFHHNGLKNEIEALETYLNTVLGRSTTVTSTEFGYLSGVTSAIQTQLTARLPLAGGTMSGNIAMGSNKLTGLAAGSGNGDSLRYEQVIGQFLLLTGGTLTGALTINPATNQLVLGGVSAGKKVTITAPAPATADRVWTIPDITADGTFAALQGTQTFTGAKTFNSLVATLAGNLVASSNKITGLAAGSANGDSIRYEQVFPFRVLQVVQATTTTAATSTSGTFADSNLTATITPASTSSTILVIVSQACEATGGNGVTVCSLQLLRGATIIDGPNVGAYQAAVVANDIHNTHVVVKLDSPATTSATTYKTQFARTAGTGTAGVNSLFNAIASKSIITLIEIG